MSVNIQPNDEMVLVRKSETETMKDGLYIPESAQKGSETFIVVAKGEKTNVDIGQRILIAPHTGYRVSIEGEDHLFVKLEHILGVFHA